ncbi:MAG TPA: bifunctional UDP-N-acetylglucosamine diphosphorylase/glucosamine-1-phosphate N-acetyltransferase GlmU, partial [Chloroflexia bacterium]|nr:bifunctional UDP-N-acetylglucosamine diphosphorylase/glucosamine-1-phosphate N-acetyltransferase GlmU [Chloroflexia bacterium]
RIGLRPTPLAAVVLAAGLGKRMVSQQPKVLHRLAGLPLAAHVLRALAPLNPSDTVLVVGHGAGTVREAIGPAYGQDNNLPIAYADQEQQLGTGHAVLMAEPLLRSYQGPIIVLYGDSPLLRTATLSDLLNKHRQSGANLTMLTCIAEDPTGYGRIVRDHTGGLMAVVEERNATLTQKAISEVNSGVYIFNSDWLWPNLEKIDLNPQGEYYLTDLIGMAIEEDRNRGAGSTSSHQRGQRSVATLTLEKLDEAMGINSKLQLAQAEGIVQKRLRRTWMEAGVTMLLPETVYLGMDVTIGPDTTLYPGVILEGQTSIGPGCVLGPNTHVIDSTVAGNCRIVSSTIEGSLVDSGVTVGPYSHLRPGAHLCENVHLGNFAEVVRSTLEPDVAMGHFSYVGDAEVGEGTNIGAGTITANYSREKKKTRTRIGKGVFLGSDTMLRAPVEVGDGAVTGLGSVVTRDVDPYTVVAGVPARVIRHLDQPGKNNDEAHDMQATKEEE